MAKHRSPEQWDKILAAYACRTVSQVEFCEKHDVSTAALGYHLRKHRPRAASPGMPPVAVQQIIELPPPDTGAIGEDRHPASAELTLHHHSLGRLTLRCPVDDIARALNQLATSRL